MPKIKTTYQLTCRSCKQPHFILAYESDINKWMNGIYIRYALPYLNEDDREMLISRICPTCWIKLFGSEEE